MPTISEIDLSVFISLLAQELRNMERELEELQKPNRKLTSEDIDERCDLQEGIESYRNLLERLRIDYEAVLGSGIELPDFEELVRTRPLD